MDQPNTAESYNSIMHNMMFGLMERLGAKHLGMIPDNVIPIILNYFVITSKDNVVSLKVKETDDPSASIKRFSDDISALFENQSGGQEAQKDERTQRIIDLYVAGKSLREISEIIGVRGTTIGDILRNEGIQLRSQGDPLTNLKEHHKEMLRLHELGKSSSEIAHAIGVDDIGSVNIVIRALIKREEQRMEMFSTYGSRVIQMYNDGQPLTDIKKSLRISGDSVHMILDHYGIERIPTKEPLSHLKEHHENMLRLHKSGKTNEEIAEIIGVSDIRTVNMAMRALINREKQRSKKVSEHFDTIIGMYDDGSSLREISDATGLNSKMIRKVLKDNGVKLRPQGDPLTNLKEHHKEMLRLHELGKSSSEIAHAIGVDDIGSVNMVMRHLLKQQEKIPLSAKPEGADMQHAEIPASPEPVEIKGEQDAAAHLAVEFAGGSNSPHVRQVAQPEHAPPVPLSKSAAGNGVMLTDEEAIKTLEAMETAMGMQLEMAAALSELRDKTLASAEVIGQSALVIADRAFKAGYGGKIGITVKKIMQHNARISAQHGGNPVLGEVLRRISEPRGTEAAQGNKGNKQKLKS